MYVCLYICVSVKLLQLCPTLCNPMNYSSLGFSVHGVLQARTPQWVTISFSRESFQPRDQSWIPCIGRRILYC